MKKDTLIVTIILCLVLVSMACGVTVNLPGGEVVRGSGSVITEERSVSGVKRVKVANQGDLIIEIGDEEKLLIEAEDNLLPYLSSDVQGGELVLRTQSNTNIRTTRPIRYYLTVNALEGLEVTSSGGISAPKLQADRFSIGITSSGDISIDSVDADHLEVDISSSGSVTIADGMLESQDISINSSGSYDARQVASQSAVVRINSSGNARIWVIEKLDVNINSSGDVYYRGDPHLNVINHSSGEVIKTGD